MSASAFVVLAQHTQETTGWDAWLIVLAVVVVIAIFAAIFLVFTRSTRRSRGGVDAPPRSQQRGNPPFEGVHRER